MNKALNQYWEQAIIKFAAFNGREKKLIIGAILSLFYGIYTILIAPASVEMSKLNQQIQSNTAQQHSLALQLNILSQQTVHPVETTEQRTIKTLNTRIAALNEKIDQLKSGLISPQKVPDLLNDLIDDTPALKLVGLETLPSESLLATKTENTSQKNAMPVFKHGVAMTIEGRYLDLVAYISKLESMPWHILWESAEISVDTEPKSAFPLSQLKLVVYSLSLDKAWLSI